MAFTCMKQPVPARLLRLQYRVVLAKIESGKLKVPVRSILDTVLKDRHVFRGGTSLDDNTVRHKYYRDLIAECKSERAAKKMTTSKKSGTKKRTQRVDLVGRRVLMCASVFGGDENEYYNGWYTSHVCVMLVTLNTSHFVMSSYVMHKGMILRKGRYPEHGKTKTGYLVRWHDGDQDYWYDICHCNIHDIP